MKYLLSIILMLVSLSAASADWSIQTANGIWSVKPLTVKNIRMGKHEEWQVDLEHLPLNSKRPILYKISATGCSDGLGFLAIYDSRGQSMPDKKVTWWHGMQSGVLNELAVRLCSAAWLKKNPDGKIL